ncbi:MAG: 2-phospho-L-lactate guanylyltransferase [Methanoregulaceae archaeon]|jgi:2-phospho-L-lactate guanylyltransferase|nr:2-phospho-L-lactate guanylyltransferase [Methanoregulaceae archaeon]
MAVPALIPFKPRNPKTRLSCVLELPEREKFAQMMLCDVVVAARQAGCDPFILGTEPFSFNGLPVVVDPAGLNESINAYLEKTPGPLLIIMADVALASASAIKRLITTEADMAIVPGTGGGTNALYLSHADRFRVSYYGMSFEKHLRIAEECDLSCEVVDSFLIHTDIDEKEDLVELLIHGKGMSNRYLHELGFVLSADKGRVSVVRDTSGTE